MDPLTIALLMAAVGGASTLYGQTRPVPELEPDYWKKFYSPSRINLAMEPMRSALEARESTERGRTYERWGGSGLVSGAGARADIRTISEQTDRLLSEALARATEGEMQRASGLGLSQFQRDLEKALAERGAWSQLGSTLMAPAAMGLGGKLAGGNMWGNLGGTLGPPGLPITTGGDFYERLAAVLSGKLGPGY